MDGNPAVASLCSIRLTCRRFKEVATPILFASTAMILDRDNSYRHDEDSATLDSLSLEASDGMKAVRNRVTNDILRPGNSPILPYFSELSKLSLKFPEDSEQWVRIAEDDDAQVDHNIEFINTVSKSISTTLGTTTFTHLTTLELFWPSSHDSSIAFENASDNFLSPLKSSYLGILDDTGPGGSREYLLWAVSEGDNDEETAPSNLQDQYPNEEHEEDFKIVSRWKNLEVLELRCTHYFDGNLIS
ncbi:hypothetical protein B0J14DRAFT_680454 [Halenospora varia]|nr:hypothetical protein B0J14DRAFT_680454 [Halenospora varia]